MSRPTLSCQEMSQTPPTTLQATAMTLHQMYQGMERDFDGDALGGTGLECCGEWESVGHCPSAPKRVVVDAGLCYVSPL